MVNHRALTASVIDSREFIAARRRADTEVLAPSGARIAFTGGTDCNDHTRIWDALDKIRAKHPDMVLLHGGSPRGRRAHCRLLGRPTKVPQVVFQPDWTRHRNAAPFTYNDRMLEALPIGVVVFPGSGIAANLADKAKNLGIPTWRFDQPGPAEGGSRLGCVTILVKPAAFGLSKQAPSVKGRRRQPGGQDRRSIHASTLSPRGARIG